MEMNELYRNEKYKILNVTLRAGEKMPLHQATSDAFVTCRKGRGKVTFDDRVVEISGGETLLIKALEKHRLDVFEDFNSTITLEGDAKIDFS